jgi:hypothetical protein
MSVFTLVHLQVTDSGDLHGNVYRRRGLDVPTIVRPSFHDSTAAFGVGRLLHCCRMGNLADSLIQVVFLGTTVMTCVLVHNDGFQLNNATPDEWVVDLRVLAAKLSPSYYSPYRLHIYWICGLSKPPSWRYTIESSPSKLSVGRN